MSKKSPKNRAHLDEKSDHKVVSWRFRCGVAALFGGLACAEKAPPPRFPEAPPPVLAEPIGDPTIVEIYGAGASSPEVPPPALTQAGTPSSAEQSREESEGVEGQTPSSGPVTSSPSPADAEATKNSPSAQPATSDGASSGKATAAPAKRPAPNPGVKPRRKGRGKAGRKTGTAAAKERKSP